MSLADALELARSNHAHAESLLFDELCIPGISTLPEHHADLARNADWLRELLEGVGFETSVSLVRPGGNPIIEAVWPGAGPEAAWVTLYGHYDVQPVDPLDAWETDPFVPTVRDGAVVARGSADNKGNHVAAILAAGYAIRSGSPVNLRFILEGEEEIWGESLPLYLAGRAAELRSDYTLLWDGGFAVDGRPVVVSAMRGILQAEVTAFGADHDVHSGTYGGVAPNPIHALSELITRLRDSEGRVTIPGFHDDVAAPEPEETREWDRTDRFAERLRTAVGSAALAVEPGVSPIDALWTRPTLDCNGILGGFTGAGTKAIIPASATAKLSMRLVPDQDPDRVFDALLRAVEAVQPPGIDFRVQRQGSARPARLSYQGRAALALRAAFADVFGVPAAVNRIGGGMRPAAAFAESIGGEILNSGANQPAPGAHAPNEHLDLDHFHKASEVILRFIFALG